MERVLSTVAFHSPYRQGLEYGRLKAIADGQAPAGQEKTSISGSDPLVPPSKKVRIRFSDSSTAEGMKVRHSFAMNLLPLPLSLSTASFSSPLNFFRPNREHDEPSSTQDGDVFSKPADFIDQEGSNWIPFEESQISPFGDEELGRGPVHGPQVLKSVDISNRMNLAGVQLASEDRETESKMIHSSDQVSKPWIRNFVKLTAFWNKENSDRDSSRSSTTNNIISQVESCQIIPLSCGCRSCGAGGSPGQTSGMNAESIEVTSHLSIAGNKEYFTKFLHALSYSERKRVTQMAYLSNLAYRIPTIEEEKLLMYYHLRMVTSSTKIKNAVTAAAARDGKVAVMEQNPIQTFDTEDQSKADDGYADSASEDLDTSGTLNPVAAFTMAATAASCNSQARDILSSKTGSGVPDVAPGLPGSRDAKNILQEDHGRCNNSSEIESPNGSHDESEALRRGQNPISGTTRTVSPGFTVSPEESTENGGEQTTPRLLHSCPCEWFVCDNEATSTRFFVIQGTETLAAWQANLRFDPTQFELESKSGVMVHRGIYEAAMGLYEEVLPLILEHVERCGANARFRFTGHSLGGSLAMLLSLMIGLRKAAPISALLPVYTFGSPCIMCGGNYLLEQLGLPRSHIQSIVMHLDIVPRTFACDYPDHVAGVLKRVSGTFRNHSCLLQQRLIYAPMGEMVILQPESEQAPGHPLLPQGSGLYTLRQPGPAQDEHPLRMEREVQSAERAFLNVPHPLEMLSDRNAYGPDGSISRDHDSRMYLRALQRIQRKELMQRRRSLREVRRQLWAPLLGTGNASHSLKTGDHGNVEYTAATESLGMVGHYQDLKTSDGLASAGKICSLFPIQEQKHGFIF